jgi:hypothetical protein
MSFQHLKHRHFQKWSSSLMPGISRLIRSSYLPINSWKPAKKTCFFGEKIYWRLESQHVSARSARSEWQLGSRLRLRGIKGQPFLEQLASSLSRLSTENGNRSEQMGTDGNSQLLPEFIKKYEMNWHC